MRSFKMYAGALLAASVLVTGTMFPESEISAASAKVSATSPQSASIRLMLEGKLLNQKAIMGQEGTLIPVQALRDSLGLNVTYIAKDKTYRIQRGNTVVRLNLLSYDYAAVTVNGSVQYGGSEWRGNKGVNYISVKVLTDHLGYKSEWDAGTKTVNLIPLKMNSVMVMAHTITKKTSTTDFKIQYPQLSGLADTAVQNSINKMLKNKADAYFQDALKDSKEWGQFGENRNEFDTNYTLTYNRDGVLSFRYLIYQYAGGAHGSSFLEGLTVRLADGKVLELDDLVKGNTTYKSKIDATVKAKLEKTEGYFGGFQTVGEKPEYYLKDNGFVIFFQQYDYLPYAAGIPEYYFPFSAFLPVNTNPFN